MLKQLIKFTIFYVLLNVSYCYQNHKMKLFRCVSCPNITVEMQSYNKKTQSRDTNNVLHYKVFYSPTLNKDYKNIINQKKERIKYLKNRERNNFK